MAELLQPSFASGELAPSLWARVDTARYQTGLRRLRNFFVRPHGGISNRAGTRYVASTKYADKASILVPFIYSNEQAYMLEFGEGYIWVYADGAPVRAAGGVNISNVVDGLVGLQVRRTITTTAPHLLNPGDPVVIENVVATGTFDVNGAWTVLEVPGATTFRVIGSGDPHGAYISGGNVAAYVEVASPYQEEDLEDLRFTQSADVLTLVHPRYAPREFRRSAPNTFVLVQATYDAGPFLDLNIDTTTFVHASARTGSVTLTATKAIFNASQVGGLFYLEQRNLSLIPPWESNKKLVGNPASTLGLLRRSDGKTYRCVTDYSPVAGREAWTGTVRPTHDKGTQADGDGSALNTTLVDRAGVSWEYRDSGFGIVRITAFTSTTQVTATVLRALPDACVGGAVTGAGPYTDMGDGVTKVFAAAGATDADRAMWEVTLDGAIQDVDKYEIDTTLNTVTFYTAPANGVAISIRQLSANNRTDVWAHGAWSEDQGYPGVVTYWQDRLIFAASRARPQTLWGSKNGNYIDFGVSVPLEDSDALDVTLNARQINAIRDLVPLDKLIIMTAAGAWKLTDGQNEVLTPTTVGFKPQSYRGSKARRCVIIGDAALYAAEGGQKMRTLEYDGVKDKFTGVNLSMFAHHLFSKSKQVVDFDYAEEPHAILWCVREDGALRSLTYDAEQGVVGWGRHDTDGFFERVCCIPEGGDNAVYFVVRRVVNGQTVRFIERLADRELSTIYDAFFVDAGLSYDGRNTSSATMTLSGSGWSVDDDLTLESSIARFIATDVGDQVWLHVRTEEIDQETGDPVTHTETVRLRITAWTSSTTVAVRPLSDVPQPFRFVPFTDWTFARDTFGNLGHLEGRTVAVFSDGSYGGTALVTGSLIRLASPGGQVHAGLPITADVEFLDVNVIGAETVRHRAKHIGDVSLIVQESRGLRAGPDVDHLDEIGERDDEDYVDPARLLSEVVTIPIVASWNKNGRFMVRQDKPLPITILGAIPSVEFGETGS